MKIPFDRYKWMAMSFRGVTLDHPQLQYILFGLIEGNIPTTIILAPNGPIVVTWTRPANA